MKRFLWVVGMFVVLWAQPGGACSWNGAWRATDMPTAIFDIEVRRILGVPEPERSQPAGHPGFEEDERRYTASHDRSRAADESELGEAIQGAPDAEDLLARYRALREDLSSHLSRYLDQLESPYGDKDSPRPASLDLEPYKDLLSRLPKEFSIYVRGATAYHAGEWDGAIAEFSSVLELPAEQRKFRSTWAAFMLGKCWMQKDPKQAGPFFERVRALAAEGFRDSLNLAADSVGWQRRLLLLLGDYVGAIREYAKDPVDGCLSLRIVCREALEQKPVDPALVQDELSRRIVTAWVLSHPRTTSATEAWLAALEAFQPQEPVAGAEYLAWVNYNGGKMDAAARWLAQSDPNSPYALWVQAKLLQREGKLAESAEVFKRLTGTMPVDSVWQVHDFSIDDIWATTPAQFEANKDLMTTLLAVGDYAGALDAAIKAEDWIDQIGIAESVLTIDKLRAFVDARPNDPAFSVARRCLARRYARQGRWAEALPYFEPRQYDSQDIRELAIKAKAHFDGAMDSRQPARSRAEHSFELGRIIREEGPDLICPGDPWSAYLPEGLGSPERRSDLEARSQDAFRDYPEMNYFVKVAAEHMWQAAQLLPDNDPFCAHALYLGGRYLKAKHPEDADRFYKALVRRNPNLLVAQQADELKWFPKEFTDVVLYCPRTPDPWYGRKRNVALALMVLGAPAGLAAATWYRRRRLGAPNSLEGESQGEAPGEN